MTEQEKADKLAKSAPALNEKELKDINNLFPHYLFRRSRTGEVWSSCCGRHEKHMNKISYIFHACHQREPRNMYERSPEPTIDCPFCGQPVIVKELGRTGYRENLCRWRRAVVLRWYRGNLWARAYDCKKEYPTEYNLTERPRCNLMSVYRFRPGKVEQTRRFGMYSDGAFVHLTVQDHGLTGGRWMIDNPFRQNFEYGTAYSVLGIEEIQKSPFRYCMTEKMGSIDFIQLMTACCFYPRKIEMLIKTGMKDVVKDLVYRGVKHATVIKWDDDNTKNPFGLNGQELREFMETDRKIETLELYKKLKKVICIRQCDIWQKEIVNVKEIADLSNRWNIPMVKLLRYLETQGASHPKWAYSISRAFGLLKDYINAAQDLGYPLHRENVLLPARLESAHDSATQKQRNIIEERMKKERQERDRLRAMKYLERKKALIKKYSYQMNDYIIRPPENKQEIVDEGRILKHCVAGYADRHEAGKVTILFMRKVKKPDEPWLTIEMSGNYLVQIHGYKNEGMFSGKGQFAPDPRIKYKDFLDTWLKWLEAGSKRNKDGTPVLKQGKKKIA